MNSLFDSLTDGEDTFGSDSGEPVPPTKVEIGGARGRSITQSIGHTVAPRGGALIGARERQRAVPADTPADLEVDSIDE